MTDAAEPVVKGLLVKVRTGPGGNAMALQALGAFEPILEVPAGSAAGLGFAAAESATWLRSDAGDNPWDRAHALIAGGFAADGSGVIAAEPDMEQSWPAPEAGNKQACAPQPQTGAGGRAVGPHYAWHLDDDYSGLRAARAAVAPEAQARVTVAHLDTGYDPAHAARPVNIWAERQRNFTKEGDPGSAIDVTPAGGMRNRGHGTGTIGILAGGDPGPQPNGVTGPIGGAPGVRVLPIRIADSVVRFTTGTMVEGFAHALRSEVDVLSMSMGGLASSALADAVNLCYEQGIVLVTAAGNFLHLVPSPRSIVYPARMRRVLAATGVMADGRPYFGRMTAMQGCHGPDSKMETAVAGWTPNIPWPELGCGAVVDLDGQGTSAATPQVAAAAALWIAKYREQLGSYSERWMRGEATRQALFQSARKRTAKLDEEAVRSALGAGSIDALAALGIAPMAEARLRRAPVASAAWDWLKLLTGRGVGLAPEATARGQMLALEILQIAGRDGAFEKVVADPDAGRPSARQRRRFLEQVRAAKGASETLKQTIDEALGVRPARAAMKTLPAVPKDLGAAPPAAPPGDGREPPRTPRDRRLRIFALDPSLGGSLEFVDSSVATVNVRFEHDPDGDSILKPGPVGDYIEVVDVDPASDRFYPPVDLDDKLLLLQDGLDPSEGNPQFHQQMVYAVAMRTITSFEEALGRRVLWAAPPGSTEYVPRLRIYPHALRAKNAYYSPNLCALLLGYFPAQSNLTDATAPGTLVFGCLSADIVAHEMTHALLDGYTSGYRQYSNPDVGSFHEAFADVVALFSHFQYKDLVRREIARRRGDLGAETLLGGLAQQFGQGISMSGPLRDYHNPEDQYGYRKTFEVHDRGSLLVKAIYQAYLAIFTRRTGDLIRLATGGTGILSDGDIHPDLVNRLTDEACKAAGHVLRMCIRALDYLAPVDITFGDYLRALITADLGQVADDRFGYRTALIESFRRRDLLPANLRTVSVESLRWDRPAPRDRRPPWLDETVGIIDVQWQSSPSRWDIHRLVRRRCRDVHEVLARHLREDLDQEGRPLHRLLGLRPELGKYDEGGCLQRSGKGRTTFEVRSVRGVRRQQPNGEISEEIIIVLAQRMPVPDEGESMQGRFWYCGGGTVVIDPSNSRDLPEIKYLIGKRITGGDADERLARERAFRGFPPAQDLRGMYFGNRGLMGDEPFAALHSTEY
jgi:hypothetical protein